MIKFDCSKCGRSYQVSDKIAGKQVRCKECQQINMVPAAEPQNVNRGDSVDGLNDLLQELADYEKTAPTLEAEG